MSNNHLLRRLPLLLSIVWLGLLAKTGEGADEYFYAIGGPEGKHIRSTLYKVHAENTRVLASVELPNVKFWDATISGDGRQLFALGYNAELFTFDAERLSLQYAVPVYKVFPFASRVFAHPKSSLIYLDVGPGKHPKDIAILDSRSRQVVKVLKVEGRITGGFVYDRARDRLYVTAAPPAIINPRALQVTGSIELPSDHSIFWMLLGMDRKNLFLSDEGSHLYVYDVDRTTVVRQTTLPGLQILRDPALSRDGRRLFAATSPYPDPGTAVVVDTQTLTILKKLTFPEPIGDFVPAPDGRGLWLTTNSGILRLDDQTGEILERVPLPFRLGKLLTPS